MVKTVQMLLLNFPQLFSVEFLTLGLDPGTIFPEDPDPIFSEDLGLGVIIFVLVSVEALIMFICLGLRMGNFSTSMLQKSVLQIQKSSKVLN